jgi:hypothetical protein
MPSSYKSRTKPHTTPLAQAVARQARQEDSLTRGLFDPADFTGPKLWAWCTYDTRREKEDFVLEQETPLTQVLPAEVGTRQVRRPR